MSPKYVVYADLDVTQPIDDDIGIDMAQRGACGQFPGVLSEDDLQDVAISYLAAVRRGKDWPLAVKTAILSVRTGLTRRRAWPIKTSVKDVRILEFMEAGEVRSESGEGLIRTASDINTPSNPPSSVEATGVFDRLAGEFDVFMDLWSQDYTDEEVASELGLSKMSAWRWRVKAQQALNDYMYDAEPTRTGGKKLSPHGVCKATGSYHAAISVGGKMVWRKWFTTQTEAELEFNSKLRAINRKLDDERFDR